MATLICGKCQHENEAERIYCHNCGAKLDRTLLPEDKTTGATDKEQKRRVKKLTHPSRGFFVGWFGSLVSTLAWAALTASAVLMSRSPDDVPLAPKKGEGPEAVPQLLMALEDAKALRTSQELRLNSEAINSYLKSAIRSKETGMMADYVKFDRAFANLEDGDFRMTAQQSVFEYPFYASVDYKLAIEDNKIAAKIIGGKIGRMPIHPLIMTYSADVIFQKLWDALRREHRLLDEMKSIDVRKDQFIMVTKPAAMGNPR